MLYVQMEKPVYASWTLTGLFCEHLFAPVQQRMLFTSGILASQTKLSSQLNILDRYFSII